MANFNGFCFGEASRTGFGHQRPGTQEQFYNLWCSRPAEDAQQISRYPLYRVDSSNTSLEVLNRSHYDWDNFVGCRVASAHQHCYSDWVDLFTKAIREFEYSLARTGVRKEIVGYPSVLQPSSSLVTHKRAQEYGYIAVGTGEKRRRVGERKVANTEVVKGAGVVAVDGARWIKHYSSFHWILLVGEGDFSFSACLAGAFGIDSKMIATSLDSAEYLKKNYQNAERNLEELINRGCEVMHGVDATEMANHFFLRHFKFDRIVFNFPFAGFYKDLPRDSQISRHRILVSKFLQNAKEMLSWNGEIHISHKTNGFHKEWDLESIASWHGLRLIEAVDFNLLDFPGYNTKCGFGGDTNFNCYPSKTFKFGLKMVLNCLRRHLICTSQNIYL